MIYFCSINNKTEGYIAPEYQYDNKIVQKPIRATFPVRARGLSRECAPPYPQRDRKRRLNGAVCRNHRIKRLVPCQCYDWHVKEPYEMSMAWEPDRRSNSFFSPPAHLCAVTYMTEISLIVTLNNRFTHYSCHLKEMNLVITTY